MTKNIHIKILLIAQQQALIIKYTIIYIFIWFIMILPPKTKKEPNNIGFVLQIVTKLMKYGINSWTT